MEKIRWAPKLRQALLAQIYQNDARGLVDAALVSDAGYRLYQRCRSIWLATRRSVECPRCGAAFALAENGAWRLEPGAQRCPTPGCGWETTAEQWHASWRHRDLLAAAAMPAVEAYLDAYPKANTSAERMVCIDALIHAFHVSLREGKLNRSLANNLIEGSHEQVLALLDRLFAQQGDSAAWRERVSAMRKRRSGLDSVD